MKFSPGDLAKVNSANPEYDGRIVEIIREAPSTSFPLPDGYQHSGSAKAAWVIRMFGEPINAPLRTGVRKTRYGVGDGDKMERIGSVDDIVLGWCRANFRISNRHD